MSCPHGGSFFSSQIRCDKTTTPWVRFFQVAGLALFPTSPSKERCSCCLKSCMTRSPRSWLAVNICRGATRTEPLGLVGQLGILINNDMVKLPTRPFARIPHSMVMANHSHGMQGVIFAHSSTRVSKPMFSQILDSSHGLKKIKKWRARHTSTILQRCICWAQRLLLCFFCVSPDLHYDIT